MTTLSRVLVVDSGYLVPQFPLDVPLRPDLPEEEHDQPEEDREDLHGLVGPDVVDDLRAEQLCPHVHGLLQTVALQQACHPVEHLLHLAQLLLDVDPVVHA